MKIAKPRKEAIDGREMEKGIVKGYRGRRREASHFIWCERG